MQVSIKDITQENVKDIPEPCRTCLYWEKTEAFEKGKQLAETDKVKHGAEKAVWFLNVLREFGGCGKILYVDGEPVGYAQYSTSNRLPCAGEYGAKKLGSEEERIAFISCLYISNKNFRGKGLGKKLLEDIIVDLKKRGFKTVETFARRSSANNPSGPLQLYLERGFRVKEEINADFALVRLDL